MNDRIENSIIYGLVRLFDEYGWPEDPQTTHFADKVKTVQDGLYKGLALTYLNRVKQIINECRQSGDWGNMYTPVYVIGIRSLLASYAKANNLMKVKVPDEGLPRHNTAVPTGNIFKHEHGCKDALDRLSYYGKTNISYAIVEEYGVPRIIKDLKKFYPRGEVYVRTDEHVPDQLRDWEYDEGKEKMTVLVPILPIVLLSTGEDE